MTVKSRKGDTVGRGRRGPAPRHVARAARASCPGLSGPEGSHTAGNSPGVNDGGGALVLASDEWAERQRQGGPRHDHRPGGGRRRLPLPRPHARQRGQEGAREGGPAARRHRPVGDQRGVRLGDAELDPDARHRRGPGQRQRRRGRDRPPDRRLGRAHPRHARARAAPPRRRLRLRGDLLAAAARATPSSSRCEPARGCSHRRPGGGARAPPRGAGRRVLRPRPHADGGLVGVPVRPRRLQGRAGQPPAAGCATRGRTSCSACAARPTRAPTRCASGSASCSSGVRVRDLQRLAPDVLAGVLPRLYPQMLALAYEPPGRGPARSSSAPRPRRRWPS